MVKVPREAQVHTALARVDRRTKQLVKRVQPGEIMVIDHADLDRVAAETIVEAQAGGVINASPSMSGRYPNLGPLLVCAAGIPLIDDVGAEVLTLI
ncbi:MAG: putative cytokinetic ring protein SteA, partial [Microthrixaceae bacterium]